ncbi:PIN domain-containing protein [Roseiarcaceae bacterium H3SJ34-1]|nr:PIN domain-containing protein [Roseiarcaceae bacterium H3SJ34-1]
MAGYTIILDACVLYPAPLRDFLLELAGSGIFRARWTDMIHDEWIRNLLKQRQDLDPARLARTRKLMNDSVLGSRVEGFEELIPALNLPDLDDRHVLAAAIHWADAIVTFNLKDFPSDIAGRYDLEILHPDAFLYQQFDLDAATVAIAARDCRARLKSPPKTADEYLSTLESQGLPMFVGELVKYKDLL